jgi:hypothetical protein
LFRTQHGKGAVLDSNVGFIAAVLDLLSARMPFRVTVKHRYEMKKKVRDLKNRESDRAANSSASR